MSFSYFPHTEEDIQAMLARIGMKSLDDLYADIPKEVFFSDDKEYDLPSAYSEEEIRRRFAELESRNRNLTIFAGAGAYDHYAPSVIPYLLQRSEFITAYTPYQAEISQGTLRYIFEFQSMISSLTGMDCANASMYDGPTATAEAVMMALASTRKKTRVLVADTLPVNVRRVIDTYAKYRGINITTLAHVDGATSLDAVKAELAAGDVAGLLVPAINKYGIIEDFTGFADAMHEQKALFMVYADPSALAVVKTPGEWDADIACGDGQTLGMPMNYGGPYVGFLACKKEHVRKLPGRVVGATRDVDGKRAFVLTLQAREQHIRREKATSNICSNQSLMSLYVTIYLALMGPRGLKEVNEMSYGGAHELYNRLIATGKFTPVFDKPFLKEFVLNTTLPVAELQEALLREGIFGALQTEEGYVSFCVTERRTPEEIDRLINVINTL